MSGLLLRGGRQPRSAAALEKRKFLTHAPIAAIVGGR
jgi:hypothetical protein